MPTAPLARRFRRLALRLARLAKDVRRDIRQVQAFVPRGQLRRHAILLYFPA